MSTASDALMAGFETLLETNGEGLLFRTVEIHAIVNRTPFDRVARTPDFNPRDTSEVRCLKTEIVTGGIPRVGEEFVDSFSLRHRIKEVRRLGEYYDCKCDVMA